MTLEQLVISAFITMFSLGLFIISLASYRRYKNVKLLVVSLVFLVFLVKGILLSFGLFSEDILRIVSSATVGGLVDVLILGLLFIATLKR